MERLRACRSSNSTPAPSCPASCSPGFTSATSSSSRHGSPTSCHRSPRASGASTYRHGCNALTGLWRLLTGGAGVGVQRRTVLGQLLVTLVPALFIAAILGVTYRLATAPEVEASTAWRIRGGGKRSGTQGTTD